jgi:hypothetical protein
MSLGTDYLRERGITQNSATVNGLELDDHIYSKKINARLGLGFPKGYSEVIWFPIFDEFGNIITWTARPLPTMANQRSFFVRLAQVGSRLCRAVFTA